MKAISKLLVAGMLAVGIAMPNVTEANASATQVYAVAKVTISDALAYRILAGVTGDLEAQLNQSLSTDFLYNEYKAGRCKITYLGYDGVVYSFQVVYGDGLGIMGCEEI